MRYEEIQERTKTVMPRDDNIYNRREWFTVSKAEYRTREVGGGGVQSISGRLRQLVDH